MEEGPTRGTEGHRGTPDVPGDDRRPTQRTNLRGEESVGGCSQTQMQSGQPTVPLSHPEASSEAMAYNRRWATCPHPSPDSPQGARIFEPSPQFNGDWLPVGRTPHRDDGDRRRDQAGQSRMEGVPTWVCPVCQGSNAIALRRCGARDGCLGVRPSPTGAWVEDVTDETTGRLHWLCEQCQGLNSPRHRTCQVTRGCLTPRPLVYRVCHSPDRRAQTSTPTMTPP